MQSDRRAEARVYWLVRIGRDGVEDFVQPSLLLRWLQFPPVTREQWKEFPFGPVGSPTLPGRKSCVRRGGSVSDSAAAMPSA